MNCQHCGNELALWHVPGDTTLLRAILSIPPPVSLRWEHREEGSCKFPEPSQKELDLLEWRHIHGLKLSMEDIDCLEWYYGGISIIHQVAVRWERNFHAARGRNGSH